MGSGYYEVRSEQRSSTLEMVVFLIVPDVPIQGVLIRNANH